MRNNGGGGSKRPIIVEGDKMGALNKELEGINTPKTPLMQNYEGSKVLMYKNLKPNLNLNLQRIMYSDAPASSTHKNDRVTMVKGKKRKKKASVRKRSSMSNNNEENEEEPD